MLRDRPASGKSPLQPDGIAQPGLGVTLEAPRRLPMGGPGDGTGDDGAGIDPVVLGRMPGRSRDIGRLDAHGRTCAHRFRHVPRPRTDGRAGEAFAAP